MLAVYNINKTERCFSPKLLEFQSSEVMPMQTTNKRIDAWWDIFMIYQIDFGLLAVGWAGLWNKRFGPIMSNF